MLSENIISESLIEAVQDAFSIIGVSPEVKQSLNLSTDNEMVISTIFIKGGMCAKASLVLSDLDAAKIVSSMLNSEVKRASAECLDGIGEMLNMIVGGVKTKCYKKNIHFEISVPMTRLGKLHSTQESSMNNIVHNFICQDAVFQVAFAYRLKPEHEKQSESSKPKLSVAEMLIQAMNRNKK